MRDSMMSAMYGAMSNEIKMNQIANNLANANTNAYKKDRIAFKDTFLKFAHDYLVDSKGFLRDKDLWPKPDVIAKPRLSEQRIDFSQGHLRETNNHLDCAILGEGFFKVRTPDGDYLTRDGSFSLSNDGRLITQRGFEVLGEGGPIVIPLNAKDVGIGPSGVIQVDGESLETLLVVDVDDKTALQKIGNNLYQIEPGRAAMEIPPTDISIEQGYLETGNVEIVTEMVSMIATQRAFELYSKMMKGTSEMDQKLITQVGRASG